VFDLLQYLVFSAAGYLGSHNEASPILALFMAVLAIVILNSYISEALALFFLSANFFIIAIFLDELAL
jgi:hypothetical protein